VGGDGPEPSWKAFFFYRHGRRYDANHERAPRTSAVLESIELCRIRDEAPEILFSVLRPGSHIKPHHGVSNIRLVMHLPLVVPPGCALSVVDHGEHAWQEGRLMMFDDTYLHEAWNRSDRTRLILLMDCWNPHLSGAEKSALKAIVEAISGLRLATRKDAEAEPGGRVMQE
jgi:aspartate beta-hydroxylase